MFWYSLSDFFNATLRFQLSMIDLINGVLQSKQKKTAMKTIIFGIGVCVCVVVMDAYVEHTPHTQYGDKESKAVWPVCTY